MHHAAEVGVAQQHFQDFGHSYLCINHESVQVGAGTREVMKLGEILKARRQEYNQFLVY
jgi:hypothetical protein